MKERIAAAHFGLAEQYFCEGEDDKSIEEYGKAIAFDPGYGEAYNARGIMYYRKKDYDKAIADYEAALRLDFASPAVQKNLENARRERELSGTAG